MFEGVPYAVLGLGDTNYDKFCNMGKIIDKRLEELGGQRQLELFCADEGTGNMEEVVEAWKQTIEAKLTQAATADSCSASGSVETKSSDPNLSTDDAKVAVADEPSKVLSAADAAAAAVRGKGILDEMPRNILPLVEVARIFGVEEKIREEIAMKPKPSREKSIDYSFATEDEVTVLARRSLSACGSVVPEDGWTAAEPFAVNITTAKWLTSAKNCEAGDSEVAAFQSGDAQQWGAAKRVIHMELSLEGSGIEYDVGDSIGVICPNAPYAVQIILERLQQAHPDVVISAHTPLKARGDAGDSIVSLGELLSFRYNLMGPPKKMSAVTLAQYCTDPTDALSITHLCGKAEPGKTLWAQFVDAQQLNIAEFIAQFPSCVPTLPQLLSFLTSMPPRYYSLTSSPLCDPNTASIAFSVVRNVAAVQPPSTYSGPALKPICRGGLCTTYLEEVLAPWLRKDEGRSNPPIRVFLKPSESFHPPASLAMPMILIGPGTGVAPFVGFLDHREVQLKQQQQQQQVGGPTGDATAAATEAAAGGEIGDVHLFFGCRDENDYLFKAALEKKVADGVLTSLDVAMSRVAAEKVYVTDKIRARSSEVAELISRRGGHIFICGDGNHMAKDVHKAIVEALVTSSADAMAEDEAEEYLQEMKDSDRYVLDIWS